MLLFTPAISYDWNPCLQSQKEKELQSFQKNLTDLNLLCEAGKKKRQECLTWSHVWDQHHMKESKIQGKKKPSSWSRLKLSSAPGTVTDLEMKRGRKGKHPSHLGTDSAVQGLECLTSTLVATNKGFATGQMFIVVMRSHKPFQASASSYWKQNYLLVSVILYQCKLRCSSESTS